MYLRDIFITFGCLSALATASPTATVSAGVLHGTSCPKTSVNAFLSVPFAEPPVGDLRFAAPKPLFKFPNGSIDATTPPPACIQFGTAFLEHGPSSEDCLFINVWTPNNVTDRTLPVKVWIYGGGNLAGSISDPLYNGCNIGTDAVVVSIAYRVGALGFLALDSAGIAGNFAVQDLLLGLQWVQDNIHTFGGNKDQVLVFGESAGAGLAWTLSSLPQAASLMKAAVAESGSGRNLVTKSEYETFGRLYANQLGCNATDIACFRSKTPAQLNASAPVVLGTIIGTIDNFQQYVDGSVIPVDPLTVGSKVPLLAGSNTLEGTLFTLGQYLNPAVPTAADYLQFLQTNFGSLATTVNKYYPISLFNATPYPAFYAISTVFTHARYRCPTRRAVQATLKAGQPAYTYLFEHVDTCSWESSIPATTLQLLGATHSSEIPFVFRNFDNLPLPNGTCSFNAQEVQIGEYLSEAWTSMAISGSPGKAWPQYNDSASQGLLVTNSTQFGLVNYTFCDFWDTINAAEANATAAAYGNNSTAAAPSIGPSSSSSSSSKPPGPIATYTGAVTPLQVIPAAILIGISAFSVLGFGLA